MKASMHFGQGKASHNDRHFDIEKAEHIDKEKQNLNQYRIISNNPEDKKMSFEDYELKYYKEHFSDSLNATNEKYISQRHPEKVRSMEDWMKTYKPTEAIIQLGNKDDKINPNTLSDAFNEYFKELRKRYPQIKPLDVAFHLDEASPHIHMRFVIEGHDKNGHIKPLKTQGLKEMGIERPDLSKPEGRYNNPLMTFTEQSREILYTEIEKMGVELDRTPHLNQQHVETLVYKKNELAKDITELQTEYDSKLEKLEADYSAQKQQLKLEYQQEQATLEKDFATKKEKLAREELKLSRKEEALTGRELSLDELKELKDKTLWSTEDKQNVLKTAKLSAKNAEKAEEATYTKDKAIRAYKKAEAEKKALEKQVPTFQEKLHYDNLENTVKTQEQTISALKEDIKVRDTFISDKGLKSQFMDYCHDIGHKLKVAIEHIGIHMR